MAAATGGRCGGGGGILPSMKVVGQTLTWAELGDDFLQQVFTPERVAPLLSGALPKQVRLRQPLPGGEAEITVNLHEPRVLRPLPDVLRVDLPLSIVVDGEVLGVIEADARLGVMVSLFLRVEPRWPLLVFLNVRPVQPDEVAISEEATSPLFDVARRLGQIPDLRVTIASAVNDEIAKTIGSRTVNVLARIDESVPERAPAATGPRAHDISPPPAVPPDHVPSEGWLFVPPEMIAAVIAPA